MMGGWNEQNINGNTLGVMEQKALNTPIGSIGANAVCMWSF